jgi:DNA-binding MurR/RpiR family transcriptional regulator
VNGPALAGSGNAVGAALRIRMALPSLNETEQRVARTILNAGARLDTMSINEVATSAEVSSAMVVKVAKKLGFEGFRHLRGTLSEYYLSPSSELHEEIDADDDAATSVSKVFSTALQALQETQSILDLPRLERAAEVIFHAGQRNLYGVGGSGIVAQDASHKFLRIGMSSTVHTDAHLMTMSASVLSKGDVAIGVSYSGQTRVVVETLELARAAGATTIVLTNFLNSPLVDCADIVLHATSRGSTLTSASVAARIAQLCLIDALFVLVAQKDYATALGNLHKTMAAVEPRRISKTGVPADET